MLRTKVEQALKFIQMKKNIFPEIGIVLGSGLGSLAEELGDAVAIPFMEIPYFVSPSVEGHEGVLVLGTLAGKDVAVMRGRLHYYEGYSMEDITFPVHVLKALGVQTLILTNASGAINPAYEEGEVVLIKDHLNFMGVNPMRMQGEPVNFLDISTIYSTSLNKMAKAEAKKLRVKLNEGTYIAVSGPTYETSAEIKAFRKLGADIIGMSTVPEAIVGHSLGLDIVGIACVTNKAAGIERKLTHQTSLAVAQKISLELNQLIKAIIKRI